jgi:hypothetical protein
MRNSWPNTHQQIWISKLSVRIRTGVLLRLRLTDRGIEVLFMAGVKDFCFLQSERTGSGAQQASYSMGIGSNFPEGKAAEV